MCLLLQAATSWINLMTTRYVFTLGYKNNAYNLPLIFEKVDFYHLSGMHYAKDVDFKIPPNKMYGDKLIDLVLSGKIVVSDIEKSKNWARIKGRLEGIVTLKEILESDFSIYKFTPNRLGFNSEILAKYLIHSPSLNLSVFLFLDESGEHFYCKSIFSEEERDYTKNQTPYKVLKKIRIQDGNEVEIFRYTSYKE